MSAGAGTGDRPRTADTIASTVLGAIVAYLLEAAGAESGIAAEVANNLVEADLLGHGSHGSRQTANYVEQLRAGRFRGDVRPQILWERGTLLSIDGRMGFGQVVGAFAAREGARLAKEHGSAVVSVTNSGHLGRNGKWPEVAAAAGVASIHFANLPEARSSVVPFGGSTPRLCSTPIALGAPHTSGKPVIVDFSVAEVAVNAIKQAFERGERLPQKCLRAADGTLTDDPAEFLSGAARAILPFGGFKGYALGIFAEIFAGAIGSGNSHTAEPEKVQASSNNLLSFYVDAAAFVGRDAYDRELDRLSEWIRLPDPATGLSGAMPGDRAQAARRQHEAQGLPLEETLRGILLKTAASLGVQAEIAAKWPELQAGGGEAARVLPVSKA